jgi:Fe-S cluster assembly protein SufD
MLETMEDKEIYLEHFTDWEKSQRVGVPGWLADLRQGAIERFAEVGFPTTQDEEWRFTNLGPLTGVAFQRAATADVSASLWDQVLSVAAVPGIRAVFINGRHAAEHSTPVPSGVTVGSLEAARASSGGDLEAHLGRHADYQDHAFVALNTAFLGDGAFVRIPRGKVVAEPIHLVFVSTDQGKPTVVHPRTLVLADVNSQATIVESYAGARGAVYFTNAVTEIVAGESAVIDHYKVQSESFAAFHVATMQVQMARSSNFSSHNVVLGGGLVRNDINAFLGGEGSECTLNGLYVGSGRQLVDNHTRIDHAKAHCASHELYKGILDGQARGVFNGKIYVHPDAQKTDAKQTNKTLLLSDDARIDSKPQLEIFADDVKCTHGATIGQLAAEAIFYLRTRGIGREEARSLLTFAFANDIVGRIRIEGLRAKLEQLFLRGRPAPEAS